MPRKDDSLDALGNAQWFSTLDLTSGYWQVQVHPDDAEKTAFVTLSGLYQLNVLPIGLCNLPALDGICIGWTSVACLSPLYR